MSNEETTIAARPPTAAQAYGRQVEQLATRELERVLGSEEGKRAAARVALAFRATGIANPTVYECDPGSVAACVATSAMTSLMPGGPNPDCYLVPRRVKGNQQLNWMISHRGLIKLATRAGFTLKARAVYKDEVFEYEEGETIHVRHVPNLDRDEAPEWEQMRGVIVRCYRISDGKQIGVEYVNRAQIEKRRNQSDAYQRGAKPGSDEWSRSSPWFKWGEEMALKTAIKYAFSRGGIPIDDILVREALTRDADDAIETTVVVQPAESSPRAIAQRDRFDESVGLREEAPAERTDDAPSGGK